MLRQVSQLGQGALSFPEKKPETTVFLGKKTTEIFSMLSFSRLLFVIPPPNTNPGYTVYVQVASEELGN